MCKHQVTCSEIPSAGVAIPKKQTNPLLPGPDLPRINPFNAFSVSWSPLFLTCYLRQRRLLKDHRTVMHACLRAGAWAEALSVWSDLRARPGGRRPCVRTYATALRACGALGLWTTARELLSEMRTAGGDLSPDARHYAFAVSAAAVADDRTFDEETARSGRGWGDGRVDTLGRGEEGAEGGGGDGESRGGEGDTALRFVLSEMAAGGAKLGWEAYAAVCWARSQRKHWHRASLGVLELIRECGLEDDSGSPAVGQQQQQQQRDEGMRSLYGRLLAAAGKIPGGGAAAQAVRQVLADAEERLVSLPGGPGPRVIAAAGVAFARAGDWESARDVALRLSPSPSSSSSASDGRGGENHDAGDHASGITTGGSGGSGEEQLSASRTGADDASSAASAAAVVACARAEELEEAEALAERLGFGHKAGLALAAAYERAGRFSDAETLRSRLQGRMATSLGLEAGGVAIEGGSLEGGREEREGAAAAPVLARLPNVGGRRTVAIPSSVLGEEEEEEDLDDGVPGAEDQYELFLQWMATGEEEEVEDEDEGGVWSAEVLGGPATENKGVVGSRAGGAPAERGSEEGLTIRELEGW